MNIKGSSTPSLNNQKISLCTRTSQSDSSTSKPQNLKLCKTEFSNWARSLPTEERFLALRMKLPELIQCFRMHTRQFGESWRYQSNEGKKNTPRLSKNILSLYQTFIDSIILMTQTDYSDSIGFQFTYVESPERIYDLLASIRNISTKTANDKSNQNKPNKNKHKKIISKSEWIHQAANQIEVQLSQRMYQKWDPKILDLQKNQKKEYANFWKNLSEEARLNLLYLGAEDFKQLVVNLVDQKINIRPNQLETQIFALLKIEKKEFCNKLFKWKLKRTSFSLCDYIELFFSRIKENLSLKTGDNQKTKRNKRKRKSSKRTKSVDACSNDTNETEMKSEQKFQQLIAKRLQSDFLSCVDRISEEANSFFQNRVLGYERFSYILDNLGIKTKLYGSCACGIAIKNSDLDIAINQSALDSFEYLSTTQAKIQALFQLLEAHLKVFKWIQIIKTIPTAYIPIIKLKIDTSIPFTIEGAPNQFFNYFNRNVKNSGSVHVDLTIQTTQQKSGLIHLGIISTKKSLFWMDQIPSLRYIVILLKNILSNKGLNETYYGGINTYTLMIMVVSFIYYADLEKQKVSSKVLEQFLKFYGWDFDEKSYLIDIRMYDCQIKPRHKDNYIYIKKAQKDEKLSHSASDLEILDPLNDGKVMTKNCYKFAQIKTILRQIYEQLFVQNKRQIEKVLTEWKNIQKIGKLGEMEQEFQSKIFSPSSTTENKYIEWMCE